MTRTTAFTLTVTLALTVATQSTGNTYHVATTGSDSNTCTQAQSPSMPKRTIGNGMGCLKGGGDTLYVRAGTYNESINVATQLGTTVGGTSFSNPVLITNYPGDARFVIFPSTHVGAALSFPGSCCGGTPQQYVIFDGFVVDATNVSGGGDGIDMQGNNNRLTNFEVKNSNNQDRVTTEFGMGVLAAGTGNQFINCDLHDNGKGIDNTGGAGYGIYINGSGHLIENCKIHDNGGFGVHVYRSGGGANSITVRYNDIYNNGLTATKQEANIVISSGSNHAVYGNIVRNYAGNGGGILINDSCVNCLVYNNTVYANGNTTLYPNGAYGIGVWTFTTGAIVKGNIIVSNSPSIADYSGGAGATFSNNLCSVSSTGCALVGNITFVDPAAGDFSLESTSPYVSLGLGAVSP
jgi:hypothetical protein